MAVKKVTDCQGPVAIRNVNVKDSNVAIRKLTDRQVLWL